MYAVDVYDWFVLNSAPTTTVCASVEGMDAPLYIRNNDIIVSNGNDALNLRPDDGVKFESSEDSVVITVTISDKVPGVPVKTVGLVGVDGVSDYVVEYGAEENPADFVIEGEQVDILTFEPFLECGLDVCLWKKY